MMRSLFSGVAGLKNHQTRMDVIGNNISNVNTTGFKSSRVNFTDMLSQNLQGASSPNGTMGGTNPKQIGLGSAVGAVDLLFTNGSVQSTGVNTDLALSSTNALFVLDTGGGTAYTRNGDFQFDADGNYVQAGNGYFVQGWMADQTGSINTSSKVGGITIPSGKSMEPVKSTTATYTNNLNASVPTIVKISGGTLQQDAVDPHEYTKSTDGSMSAETAYPVEITIGSTLLNTKETEGTYKVGDNYKIGAGCTNTSGTLKATSEEPVTITTAGGSTIKAEDGQYVVPGVAVLPGNASTGAPGTAPGTAGTLTIGDGQDVTEGTLAGTKVAVTLGASGGSTQWTLPALQNGSFKIGDTLDPPYELQTGELIEASADYTVEISTDGGTTWTTTGVLIGTKYPQTTGQLARVSGRIAMLQDSIDTLEQPITNLSQPYLESAVATADDAVTLTMSDGTKVTQTSGKYTVGHSLPVVTTLPIYDTLGSVHELTVYFTLTDAKKDTWEVSLTNDGTNSIDWKEADGSTTTATMQPTPLDFDTNGAFASGSGKATLRLTNGSTDPQVITIDFSQLTQYDSSSTIAGKADGNAAGTLSSIAIDKTGVITGTYTNGEKRAEAQIALQRFTNPGGLTKVGESLYEDSNNAGKSGEPSTAATLGATITPSALEMSNVDVANEFTDMIITQRGFQSNSKIITTSDEMLETLINLKR